MRRLCSEVTWRIKAINELLVLLSFKMLTHAKTKIQIPEWSQFFMDKFFHGVML